MRAVVFSLGCKVNQCEGQSMIAQLCRHGIEATDKLEPADFYILNTCSVTAEADRKSRQTVSRMLSYNPDARIYVCGCSSQYAASAFAEKDNVHIVSGTGKKAQFVQEVLRDYLGKFDEKLNIVEEPPKSYEDSVMPQHTKTRSYLKIQDGCNNFCSYCIIPYLRGRSRSRSIESVVREAKEAARSTAEIVLTGVDTSSFGLDSGESFSALIRALGDIPVRKRIGSLECTVIDDELLEAMKESGFCDHFHLSLQSGSESVLRRMNRKYMPDFFADKVEKIRRKFPDSGITTDIITGFGGETEREFAQTVDFVKRVRFTDMHVFPYSERVGTAAVKLPQIDKSLRCERANILIELGKELRGEFLSSQLGKVCDVYAEACEGGESAGYTSNYIKVYSTAPIGKISKVKLKKIYKEGVKGEIYE